MEEVNKCDRTTRSAAKKKANVGKELTKEMDSIALPAKKRKIAQKKGYKKAKEDKKRTETPETNDDDIKNSSNVPSDPQDAMEIDSQIPKEPGTSKVEVPSPTPNETALKETLETKGLSVNIPEKTDEVADKASNDKVEVKIRIRKEVVTSLQNIPEEVTNKNKGSSGSDITDDLPEVEQANINVGEKDVIPKDNEVQSQIHSDVHSSIQDNEGDQSEEKEHDNIDEFAHSVQSVLGKELGVTSDGIIESAAGSNNDLVKLGKEMECPASSEDKVMDLVVLKNVVVGQIVVDEALKSNFTNMTESELHATINFLQNQLLVRDTNVLSKQGGQMTVDNQNILQLHSTDSNSDLSTPLHLSPGSTASVTNSDVGVKGSIVQPTIMDEVVDVGKQPIEQSYTVKCEDGKYFLVETTTEDELVNPVTDLVESIIHTLDEELELDDTNRCTSDELTNNCPEGGGGNNADGSHSNEEITSVIEDDVSSKANENDILTTVDDVDGVRKNSRNDCTGHEVVAGRVVLAGSREDPIDIDKLILEKEKLIGDIAVLRAGNVNSGKKTTLITSTPKQRNGSGVLAVASTSSSSSTHVPANIVNTPTNDKEPIAPLFTNTSIASLQQKLTTANLALARALDKIKLLESRDTTNQGKMFADAMKMKHASKDFTTVLETVTQNFWQQQIEDGYFTFGNVKIATKYVDLLYDRTVDCTTYRCPRICQMTMGVQYCLDHVLLGRVGYLDFDEKTKTSIMNYCMYRTPGLTEGDLASHYNTYNGNFWNPKGGRHCPSTEEFLGLPPGEIVEVVTTE